MNSNGGSKALRIVDKVSDLIGNTPIMRIALKNGSTLFLKLEQFNPTGSIKIRMARNMMEQALSEGYKREKGFVESTSGNTGMGLALLAAEKKTPFKAIVDHHASVDKVNCMKAFGADIVFVGEDDGSIATDIRDALAADISETSGAYWTEQHNNPNNPDAYEDFADELCDALGEFDALFGAIGTGGSLCGTAKYLRKRLPNVEIHAVEPEGSIIFGKPACDYLQSGTGTPEGAEVGCIIDYDVIDRDYQTSDVAAFETCRYFAKHFGLMVGGSAGGVLYEALNYASQDSQAKDIVVVICDGGEKYLDTVFNDEWMKKHELLDHTVHERIKSII